jgi:AraC-like DNA-binding protein
MNKALRTEVIHHTVGSYAVMIARGLEEYDIDPQIFLDAFELNLKTLDSTSFRISEEMLTSLWKKAVELSGDETFGITAGRHVTPTSFNAISMSLWLCNTLKDGLDRLLRYTPIFTTSANASFIEDRSNYRMDILIKTNANNQPVVCHESIDAFISAAITICRNRYGNSFSPIEVQLPRNEPSAEVNKQYEDFFNCKVGYSNVVPHLIFTKESLDKQLSSGNVQLFELTEQAIINGMNELEIGGIVGDIRNTLKGLLPSGDLSVNNIASELHMSARSLQRKLLEQGLNYRQVLDDYRRELAIVYIRQPKLSQGEISYQLGFSSPSNFSRAFKNWTGISPGEYRSLESP